MQHERQPRQDEVDDDDAQALPRATGGVADPSAPDQGSTTGTTPNEQFVGRVSG